ncbi:hypothetical protein K450DRAFT_252172 [Umbelopsis ramanniana AG]|uniref:UDENN FLCN/SMCR8-type domain-containing protein n=1 Tax=Umbelopsis ramanniana AG TaxID=1314678 RepID=A0AAD5E6U6_UMBRA|nr:uncharacterized protein K450DRAFT_252172 [Umbelopsis ramanniana AG]KAI8577376.1 hypothetical protein K450DRAFT_252172 [Umbelopsis ramanniana AG]
MNALLSVLHFCEVHGPSVLFCTQTIHRSKAAVLDLEALSLNPQLSSSPVSTPSVPVEKIATSRTNSQQSPTFSSLSSSASNCSQSSCPACTAQMPLININDVDVPYKLEASGMITKDDEDDTVFYLGCRAPQQQHLYAAVRNACVRSLTVEFCPGREGPILFGDDENGYVMSYIFKLRDSQARGKTRHYAFAMLMTDRVFLVSCWPFLVKYGCLFIYSYLHLSHSTCCDTDVKICNRVFRSTALNLQEKAEAVYQREREFRERHPPSLSAGSNRRSSFAPTSPGENFGMFLFCA